MLSDGGRLGDIGKNFRSNNVLQVFAFIALQIQVCFQNSVVYSGECQLNGNSLICERLSLVRIPLEVEGLQGVESLMVGSNLIGELKPQDVTRLPKTLKKLDLTDNRLTKLNFKLLDAKLQDLRELVVSKNRVDAFLMSSKRNSSELILLDLSYNLVEDFRVESEFLKLQKLDLKFNKLAFLPSAAFGFLSNLQHLDLSGNPIHVIPDFSFGDLKSLKVLLINFMPLLSKIEKQSLFGLTQLKLLEIRNNPRLETIDLQDLSHARTRLDHLDLSSNSIRQFTFPDDLGNLSFADVSNNVLECDCFSLGSLQALQIVGQKKKSFNLVGFSCTDPSTNDSYRTLSDAVEKLTEQCPYSSFPSPSAVLKPKIIAQIGESLLIGCPGLQDSDDVVWLTNRKEIYARFSNDSSVGDDLFLNDSTFDAPNRFVVLSDGSLFIRKVFKSDGGDFVCFSNNRNFTDFLPSFDSSFPHSVFSVKLDYTVLTRTSVASMIVGAATAGGFFVASAVLGAVRYAFNTCSRKEKRKKKSIREILEKMSGFKTAQMGRFSAYRTAKMDKLLAFKSATMDQLYAFKTARVDKLRTYKQATVTTILHHMDRMREHYAFQSSRIKDNCSQQVDKLRETYDTGCGRFKDYRSQRVEKMRENYNNQVCKIREYGQQQLSRLREQYKTQQQYLLKLLELIDVGNCITVIEAECLKTESVIFDADISFDLEPRPIRMPESLECPSEDPGSEDGMMEEEDRVDLEEFLEELRSFGDNEDDCAVGGFGIDSCFCGVSYGDISGRDDVGDKGGNGADYQRCEASNLTLGKKMKKFKKKKIQKAVDTSSSPSPCPPITKDTKVKWSSRKKSKTTLHSLSCASVPNYHLQMKPNQPTVAEKTEATAAPPDQSAVAAVGNDLDLRVSRSPRKEDLASDGRSTSRDESRCGNDRDSENPKFTGPRGDCSVQHCIIDCGEERSSIIDNNTKVDIGSTNDNNTVPKDACSSGDDDDDDRGDVDDGGDKVVSIVIHSQQAI